MFHDATCKRERKTERDAQVQARVVEVTMDVTIVLFPGCFMSTVIDGDVIAGRAGCKV